MPLLFGLLLLACIVVLLKWYADADVKALKSSLRWTGVAVAVIAIGLLAATGRLGAALAFFAGLIAWAWRVFGVVQMMRQFGGIFGGLGFGRGAGATPHQTSDVTSAFLAMRLDHASGALDGDVLQGRFHGRPLATLGHPDLLSLLQEVAADPDSRGLLEAYLDRRWPDWRDQAGPAAARTASSGQMDEAESLRILGLKSGASAADIKDAHRRLMTQLHPDRGGSDYLAAKVNAAKDFLLKGRS